MEVNLKQAISMFFSQSSFDMVYLEAVANALDAGASNIQIHFSASTLSNEKSFNLVISDNGIGFTDERYKKFCRLLDVDKDDKAHRGLGRLVYLFYFDKVKVSSHYNGNQYREFNFDNDFGAQNADNSSTLEDNHDSGSILEMTGYNLKKLKTADFANAEWIRRRILKKFYSLLYKAKKDSRDIIITIQTTIGTTNEVRIISAASMPDLEEKTIVTKHSLDGEMTLYYSINECEAKDSSVITAISIDNRNESIDVFADDRIPVGYDMVFILYSDTFQGQTDATRQVITLRPDTLRMLQKTFRDEILSLLAERAPKVIEETQHEAEQINDQFPHLRGYFEENTIGISSKADVIKDAQTRFIRDQREILCKSTESLTDADFERSMSLAGRALTEYILFRQKTIERLKGVDKKDLEATIHNVIVPQRTVLREGDFNQDIYKNNSWILDDKFMTYSTALSEMEMTDLIKELTKDENVERNDDRPDIAIIFSSDPKTSEKFDVVIVELKRKGLKPEENVRVEVQLEKRARGLFAIYSDKIQSLWLYGVVELDNEYKSHLSTAGYQPLFSKGSVFVNTNYITVDWESGTKIPAVRYVLDFDAVINDADARNKTFLNLIRSKFETL
ncbi:MAG: ATP-binding protein [Alistipes sp.]|nr:ATP-binding protein [Alistipes sp.]